MTYRAIAVLFISFTFLGTSLVRAEVVSKPDHSEPEGKTLKNPYILEGIIGAIERSDAGPISGNHAHTLSLPLDREARRHGQNNPLLPL
jgi:hypothetical protein